MSLELALQQNTAALNAQAAAINALAAILTAGGASVLPAVNVEAGEQPAPAESTKTTRTKPKKEAAPAAETVAEAGTSEDEPGEQTSAAPTYTETMPFVINVSRAKGREAALDVLRKYGATKGLSEVKASDYAKVIADCKALLA